MKKQESLLNLNLVKLAAFLKKSKILNLDFKNFFKSISGPLKQKTVR